MIEITIRDSSLRKGMRAQIEEALIEDNPERAIEEIQKLISRSVWKLLDERKQLKGRG